MPKRRRSSEDDSPHQYKTYVTQKEVDKGVASPINMKAIYTKTLDMLYQGARLLSFNNNNNDYTNVKAHPSAHINGFKPHTNGLKTQSHFTSDGRLSLKPAPVDSISASRCASCPRVQSVMFNRCSFCEKFTCESCLKICMRCGQDYCGGCTQMIYEQSEEGAVCLSCL